LISCETSDFGLKVMFGQKKKRGLYYLLPGMNRANRIRQRQILRWSILVGILCAILFGLLIYWLNSPRINYRW
jgi:hypothetical protein